MNYLRELTVGQMIAVAVLVLVLLIGAMVAFNLSRQRVDPFLAPTATLPVERPDSQFEFQIVTRAP